MGRIVVVSSQIQPRYATHFRLLIVLQPGKFLGPSFFWVNCSSFCDSGSDSFDGEMINAINYQKW